MNKVYALADPHWGHDNIINVPGRRGMFSSPLQHDELIIDNWNSVVRKNDTVYLLGDVGYDRKGYITQGIIPRLKGRIHVIGGNHDTSELVQAFWKVSGVAVYKHTVLTHIPIHPQEMYWDFNIHGHVHSNYVKRYTDGPAEGVLGTIRERDVRYICVSMEHIGFTPVNLLELIEDHRGRWGEMIDKRWPLPAGRVRR